MWYQIFCTSKVLKFMISLKHPEIFLLSLALLFVSLPFFFAKTSSKYQKISFLTHSVSHLVQWLSQLLLFRYVKSHHSIEFIKTANKEDCPALVSCSSNKRTEYSWCYIEHFLNLMACFCPLSAPVSSEEHECLWWDLKHHVGEMGGGGRRHGLHASVQIHQRHGASAGERGKVVLSSNATCDVVLCLCCLASLADDNQTTGNLVFF